MTCEEFMCNLDAFMDGEMTAEQENALFEHAEQCAVCAQELQAALVLRDNLTELDEPVAVPLDVQASWRKAVRAEAAHRKMSRFTKAVAGIAAAVCVCVLGIGMTRGNVQTQTETAAPTAYIVEADGTENGMTQKAVGSPAEYASVTVTVENAQNVREQFNDLCTEYNAVVDHEASDEANKKVYVTLPQDSAEDFFAALGALGKVEGTPDANMCINFK